MLAMYSVGTTEALEVPVSYIASTSMCWLQLAPFYFDAMS